MTVTRGEAHYRVRQLWWALTGELSTGQQAEVRNALGPQLNGLFAQMHRSERFHAYKVWLTLRQGGPTTPELDVAALLHDVGKSKLGINLSGRISVVLGRMLVPTMAQRWGQAEPKGWFKPFVVAAQHPQWGAEMVEAAGASPASVWLIANHQHPITLPPPDPIWADWLDRLKAADDLH